MPHVRLRRGSSPTRGGPTVLPSVRSIRLPSPRRALLVTLLALQPGLPLAIHGCAGKPQPHSPTTRPAAADEREAMRLRMAELEINIQHARQSLAASTAEHQRKDHSLLELQAQLIALQRAYDEVAAAYAEAFAQEESVLPAPLRRRLGELATTFGDWVRFDAESNIITFRSDFLFEPATGLPTTDARAALGELAQVLATPACEHLEVLIAAHTDMKPLPGITRAAEREAQLAAAERALNVVASLRQGGLEDHRLAMAAWGASRPAASNDTADGRAANRRIEIWILNPRRRPEPIAGITDRVRSTPGPTTAPARDLSAKVGWEVLE